MNKNFTTLQLLFFGIVESFRGRIQQWYCIFVGVSHKHFDTLTCPCTFHPLLKRLAWWQLKRGEDDICQGCRITGLLIIFVYTIPSTVLEQRIEMNSQMYTHNRRRNKILCYYIVFNVHMSPFLLYNIIIKIYRLC